MQLEEEHVLFHSQYMLLEGNETLFDHPHTLVVAPVFDDLERKGNIVAFTTSHLAFDRYMGNLLPDNVRGIQVIISNTCNQSFSYELIGHKVRANISDWACRINVFRVAQPFSSLDFSQAIYLGPGDWHDTAYDDMKAQVRFSILEAEGDTSKLGYCHYSFVLYPNSEFEDGFKDNLPALMAALAGVVFSCIALAFFMYDRFVKQRNSKVVNAAAESNAMVLSLFPAHIRDQMLTQRRHKSISKPIHKLKGFLSSKGSTEFVSDEDLETKPIADLFLETTVAFADIVGFTAW